MADAELPWLVELLDEWQQKAKMIVDAAENNRWPDDWPKDREPVIECARAVLFGISYVYQTLGDVSSEVDMANVATAAVILGRYFEKLDSSYQTPLIAIGKKYKTYGHQGGRPKIPNADKKRTAEQFRKKLDKIKEDNDHLDDAEAKTRAAGHFDYSTKQFMRYLKLLDE